MLAAAAVGAASSRSPQDGVAANDELIFKIVVLGSSGSGKSTLLRALLPSWKWPSNSEALAPPPLSSSSSSSSTAPSLLASWRRTVGVEFASRVIAAVKPGVDVRLQFWDTGGDEALHYTPNFASVLRETALALVVFDSTSPASFRTAMDVYLSLLEQHAPHLTPECVVMVENKIALRAQVEAAKNAIPTAMRRLKRAVSASEQNGAEGAESPTQRLAEVELVDVVKAQAELFQRIPDASYVELHRGDVERIEFLLSGVVDLLLGIPQSIAFLSAKDNNDDDRDEMVATDEEEAEEEPVSGVTTLGSLAAQRAKPSAAAESTRVGTTATPAPRPTAISATVTTTTVARGAKETNGREEAKGGADSGSEAGRASEDGSQKRATEDEERERDSDGDKNDDEEPTEEADDRKKSAETDDSDQHSDAPPFSPASVEENSGEEEEVAAQSPQNAAARSNRHQDPQRSSDTEFVAVHPTVAAKGSRLASWRTTTSKKSPGSRSEPPPQVRATARFREVDDDAAVPRPNSDEEDEDEAEPEIVVSSDDSNDSSDTRQRKRRLRALQKKRKKLLKKKQKEMQQPQTQNGGCGCCAVQ